MKNKKEYRIILWTIAALAVDLLGRVMADRLTLPIWCDSIGTFLIAYMAGPVCGGIVGFTNNIVYGIFVDQQSVYCIVGALLGIVVGYFAKKKVFESQFRTMTLGMGLALFSTGVAVVLNTVLYDGQSGNIWGNQVIELCIDKGFPTYLANLLGQFCVEFLDKLLCVEIVYLCIRLFRSGRARKQAGTLLVLLVMAGVLLQKENVQAREAADYDSYVQMQYGKEEGLLSGEANDIAQTKDGKLWIGTYAGLFRYDGTRFKLFQDIDSVKNVNCLYVDEEGRLWVGTNDDGVTILINEHVMNVLDEENGLLSNSVKSIVCDSDGNYYIGTTEGLSQVSLSSGVKVKKTYKQIRNIKDMSADENGNVMIVTERGKVYWLKDGEISKAPQDIALNNSLRTVCFTDDCLLVGTEANQVLIYQNVNGQRKLLKTVTMDSIEAINSFYITEEQEIFVCSDTGVAVLQLGGSYEVLNTGNFTSSIDNMLIDYQGNLWFSSSRLGLLELCQSPFADLFREIGETAVVNTTEKWQGLLFCGTDQGLVILGEDEKSRVENEISEFLQNTRVRCLTVDSRDQLWIATTGLGICRVSAENGKYHIRNFTEEDGMPGTRFRNICELSDGRIVAAGDYGVAILSGNTVEQVFSAENGLMNEKSLCLLADGDSFYIGSDGGGITQIKDDKIVAHIGKEDGLSSDVILRMVADPVSGGIYIVTSNGLCYRAPDGTIKYLKNFPYSNNYDMICDTDGTCWVLGSAGIYIADTTDLVADEKTDYLLINAKRGFRSSLVANAWMYREGEELYLCCDSGVVKVSMAQYDMTAKSYRMILDYVYVDGEKYDIDRVDTFRLASDADKIVLEPEVLNYSMNDPYVSVFLEGYDEKPTVCLLSEMDKLTYQKLKPGIYTFRIAILDGADGAVVESANYKIEKETEMYQNWWFKLYVIFIAGLVLIWITWFITRTQAQRTLLKQKYELEYAKKQIQMGNETILSIARTVDAKDSNTSEHSFRVSEYSVAIAKRLQYSKEKCENLRQMALLHDIGKIGIPDAILNKPGRLTDEEYAVMKTHVTRGGEILKDFTMIDNVSVGALYHHERYDGSGYCVGLKGEEIPLDARIIGIADAFDAMTANRVYRKQLDIDFVIGELKRCSGTQFDPKLVDILLSLIEDGTIDVEKLYAKSKEDK